jgi:hypothetical protein
MGFSPFPYAPAGHGWERPLLAWYIGRLLTQEPGQMPGVLGVGAALGRPPAPPGCSCIPRPGRLAGLLCLQISAASSRLAFFGLCMGRKSARWSWSARMPLYGHSRRVDADCDDSCLVI